MKMKRLLSLAAAAAALTMIFAPMGAQAAKTLEEGDLIGIVLPTVMK